jgi:hypothetical protein
MTASHLADEQTLTHIAPGLLHLNTQTSVTADPCTIEHTVSVISCLLPTQEARCQRWLGTPRLIDAADLEVNFSKEQRHAI